MSPCSFRDLFFIFLVAGSQKMFSIFIFTCEISLNFPHNPLKRRISSEGKVQATSSDRNQVLRETFVKYISQKRSISEKQILDYFLRGQSRSAVF